MDRISRSIPMPLGRVLYDFASLGIVGPINYDPNVNIAPASCVMPASISEAIMLAGRAVTAYNLTPNVGVLIHYFVRGVPVAGQTIQPVMNLWPVFKSWPAGSLVGTVLPTDRTHTFSPPATLTYPTVTPKFNAQTSYNGAVADTEVLCAMSDGYPNGYHGCPLFPGFYNIGAYAAAPGAVTVEIVDVQIFALE